MPAFSEVKQILDTIVAGRDPDRLRRKHGGDLFAWDTATKLLCAEVSIPEGTFRLIDPQHIGNGQAEQTYLIRVLAGPLVEHDIPRMPLGGPYATPIQIQLIRDWINEGADNLIDQQTELNNETGRDKRQCQ